MHLRSNPFKSPKSCYLFLFVTPSEKLTKYFPLALVALNKQRPKIETNQPEHHLNHNHNLIEIYYLFVRNPLRLIQGKRTGESTVLRYHAESARAPDQLFTVRHRGHVCVYECAAAEKNSTDISRTTSQTDTPSA